MSSGAMSKGVNFSLFNKVISAPLLINNPASCTRPSSQAKCLKICNYNYNLKFEYFIIYIFYNGVFP